jgi:biopolymer transport protein ExbD
MKLLRAQPPPPAILFVVAAIQLPLLIVLFFLIGSSFLLQPGISVSVPDSPFVLSPRTAPKVVAIPPPPSTAVFFDGAPTDLAGLRESLEGLRGSTHTIVIRADRLAVYDRVVEAMNIALDAGFPVVLATGDEAGLP